MFDIIPLYASIIQETVEGMSSITKERSNTGTMDGFNLRSVDIFDDNAVNLIYVFQLESEGFILVAGDDRVQPLLAYSFESSA